MAPKPTSPSKANFDVDAAGMPPHGYNISQVLPYAHHQAYHQQADANYSYSHWEQQSGVLANHHIPPQHEYTTSGAATWTDSGSEYSPPSVTPSSESGTGSGAESHHSEADTTPIPPHTRTISEIGSRGRTKTMMQTGAAGGNGRMKMSNVRARVANYEQHAYAP